jgi:hypothetical protein
MEPPTELILDALRQAAREPHEQRLYRSSKTPGLFASRTGPSAEAALTALRDGLLEVARSETKGKTVTEWVRITPRGIEFLHAHESPARALEELLSVLRTTQDGIPVWMAEIRKELDQLGSRLTEEVQTVTHRLELLSQRVLEVLRRTEAAVPPVPSDLAALVPWGPDALSYLDHRKATGVVNYCSLPELFTALRDKHAGLLVKEFHDGLRALHDRGVVRLLPYEGSDGLPEPEYALPSGSEVYYHVAR